MVGLVAPAPPPPPDTTITPTFLVSASVSKVQSREFLPATALQLGSVLSNKNSLPLFVIALTFMLSTTLFVITGAKAVKIIEIISTATRSSASVKALYPACVFFGRFKKTTVCLKKAMQNFGVIQCDSPFVS